MTHSGHGQELIEYAVVQEIKGRHRTWIVEIVGAVHDVGTKALGEFIDCHLQLALGSRVLNRSSCMASVRHEEIPKIAGCEVRMTPAEFASRIVRQFARRIKSR